MEIKRGVNQDQKFIDPVRDLIWVENCTER
jgi:hypothetical protein